MPDGKVCPEQFRGWLLKWTNYIKGYQKRWFVLSNGLLSYYRTQEEMAHTCRGTVNLAGAFIDTIDATNFVITNGPSQVYHLRALNEVERQRWVTALELAKAKAIKNLDSDISDDESGGEEERGSDNPLAGLRAKMKELNTSHDLVSKNCHQLMRLISDAESTANDGTRALDPRLKEKLALFKVSAGAMVKAAEEFVVQAQNTDRRWSRALQHEHSIRLQLQENMEKLATEMHGLETEARRATFSNRDVPGSPGIEPRAVSTSISPKTTVSGNGGECVGRVEESGEGGEESEEDEKFFDAEEVAYDDWMKMKSVSFNLMGVEAVGMAVEAVGGGGGGGGGKKEEDGEEVKFGHKRNPSAVSVNEAQLLLSPPEPDQLPVCPERTMSLPHGPDPSFFEKWEPTLARRRTTIPPKPSHRLNLWTIMKNCIGRDLSKIPMPVNFNEPTSILQRMVEDMLYEDILEKAAACDSSLDELAHLAVYSCSVYGTTAVSVRVGKPFNPMLGETYECDRRAELGWRVLLEQVSHHPPMFAMHIEHKDYTMWEEFTVASKFRGKYLLCYPIGNTHIVFHRSGNHYTWNKVVTTIQNIIIGRLWIDQSGDAKITNHTTGDEAHIKFHAYSYFSRERQRKITGTICDSTGRAHYVLKGHWDQGIHVAKVLGGEGKNMVTGEPDQLWQNVPPEPGHELIYGFSQFTCSLNEPEEGVAPTDSRLRPDQRIMEEGDFEGANKEKLRLEEKQRAKRRKREAAAAKAAEAAAAGNHEEAARLEKESSYSPLWFKKEYDPLTNTMMHVYKGGYWEGKYRNNWGVEFPDIF